MQPYFFPYGGYFRLLAAADVFIVLDDVQFPRRGRVHRCEVPGPGGAIEWLTLPLARQSRDIKIRDLEFASEAQTVLAQRLEHLPWLRHGIGPLADAIRGHLRSPLPAPCDFIADGVGLVAGLLGLPARRIRASSLDVDRNLRGQDYIIALAQAAGATTYVNPPGGRSLYDPVAFAAAGMTLQFLTPYEGQLRYLLPALVTETPETLRRDITEATALVP